MRLAIDVDRAHRAATKSGQRAARLARHDHVVAIAFDGSAGKEVGLALHRQHDLAAHGVLAQDAPQLGIIVGSSDLDAQLARRHRSPRRHGRSIHVAIVARPTP
jgi:hypothetical protein